MNYDEHLISIFAIRPILFDKIHTVKRTRCQPWKKDWQWHDEILRRNKLGVNPKCVLQMHNYMGLSVYGRIIYWKYYVIDNICLFYCMHTHMSLRWPIAMGWRPSTCDVRRPLTFSYQKLLSQFWPNLVCSIFRVRRQEIVNFITLHPKER